MDLLFFRVDQQKLLQISTKIGVSLYDDTNSTDSFVFDLPNQIAERGKKVQTVALISWDIVKTLSLSKFTDLTFRRGAEANWANAVRGETADSRESQRRNHRRGLRAPVKEIFRRGKGANYEPATVNSEIPRKTWEGPVFAANFAEG